VKGKRKKSSTQKGKEFEDRVFLIFSKLLSNDELFVPSSKSKIYTQKGYYSKDRQNNIFVDISVETFIDQSNNYSLLTVIECKNYNTTIPVDDIEEFKSKLDQIAGKNVKGIMVTRLGFDQGTVNYAKSNGIALVRLLNTDEINWDVYRTTYTAIKTKDSIERFNNEIQNGLLNNNIERANSNYCFCKYCDNYYNSLSDLLFTLGIRSNSDNVFIEYYVEKNFVNIPYITKEEIENTAKEVLEAINKETQETPIDNVITYVAKEYGVKIHEYSSLGFDRNGNQILALFSPQEMTIEIRMQLDEHRKRFAVAHEIGHIILHSPYLINPISEIDSPIAFKENILDANNIKRAETQANIFAADLLMPRKEFLFQTVERALFLGYKAKNGYFIYVDEQPCNLNNFKALLRSLSKMFNVSMQAVEYHLKSFGGLIKDGRKNWNILQLLF
jgi:Zn-dependent peptidase ImmA (M78 family)